MKKFSKVLENNGSGKYKIMAYIELEIEADNEGEASYIADSTLSSIKDSSSYIISKIEKLTNLEDV